MDLDLSFTGEDLAADLTLDGADLATGTGLRTATIISLFTDARARPDDALPEGESDRRGWWGDVVPPAGVDSEPWRTGSRLWLLGREKQTAETARRAEGYCREALAWMTRLGIATNVEVSAAWAGLGRLDLAIVIERPALPPARYAFAWSGVI